jgi:hypothetical protein
VAADSETSSVAPRLSMGRRNRADPLAGSHEKVL